jgi:hypothetical protein
MALNRTGQGGVDVSNDNYEKKRMLARMMATRASHVSARDVDAIRSTKGQIKGLVTQDTLYRLRQVVAAHQKAVDEFDYGRIIIILGLCDTYIQAHGAETSARAKEKLAAVDKMRDDANLEFRDWGRRQAEAQYLQDAYGGAKKQQMEEDTGQELPVRKGDTRLVRQTEGVRKTAIPQTESLAKREKPDRPPALWDETLKLVKQYGLTEGEILAVKVYTASDYKYMNPATANSDGWMAGQAFEEKPKNYATTDEGIKELRSLMEEGQLHSAMAVSALKKLPLKAGPCYRGRRMTEADFVKKYGDLQKPVVAAAEKLLNLTSVSMNREVAEDFANGRDCKKAEKIVSLMIEIEVKAARDISKLSLLPWEMECLLMPGASVATDSIVRLPGGKKGNPEAFHWYLVKEHEE